MFIAQKVYKMSCFHLANILLAKSIPLQIQECFDGYVVILFDRRGNKLMSAAMHSHTYGGQCGLFEIMGGLTFNEMEEDEVLGWLDTDEVVKRMEFCWELQTATYIQEG